MDRRSFFTSCVLVAVPIFLKENSNQSNIRRLHRFNREDNIWVRVQPADIRAGDVIWVDDAPSCDTVILVDRVDDMSMYSVWEINKETNEWIPAGSQPVA